MFKLFARTWAEFAARPVALVANVAAITLTAFLAGLCLLVLANVESQLSRGQGRVDFQVYSRPDAPDADVAAQWTAIRNMDGLVNIQTFTPNQALGELGRTLETDLGWMTADNPLPATAQVGFAVPPGRAELPQQLRLRLSNLPGVERVTASPLQMESARAWAAVGRTAAWVLTGLLALTAGLLTAHTVQQALCAKAGEIEILRLVGATEGYIRQPLVLAGALQGLLGGVLALGLLKLAQVLANNAVAKATALSAGVDFLPAAHAAGLPLAMTLTCALASLACTAD